MFALPGILFTIFIIYLRPQEVFTDLARIPLLYILLGLSLFGLALDLKLRLSRPAAAPQLTLVLLYILWCGVTLVVNVTPDVAFSGIIDTMIPLVLYLIVAHGVQTFRALQTVAVLILAICLFLAYIGVDQRFGPRGCHALTVGSDRDGVYDGRECETKRECEIDSPEPGTDGATVYSRMFAPELGVAEDPATGGASGPLGCYLVRHKIVPPEKAGSILSLQGVKMGRPSHIHIAIGADGGEISSVRVGGESVLAGEGIVYI